MNCPQARTSFQRAYYNSEGKTVSESKRFRDIEQFGKDDRAGGYTVNLKLLPDYGEIKGELSLPDGKRANTDIEISLVALDQGGIGYSNWAGVITRTVTIKAAANKTSFRFLIKESEPTTSYRIGSITLGYSCLSQACSEHGLIGQGWLGRDMINIYTSDLSTYSTETNLANFSMTESDTFNLELPSAITLLPMIQKSIVVPRVIFGHSSSTIIKGKIIVEKLDYYNDCFDGNSQSNRHCTDWDGYPFYVKTSLVSETEFSIEPNETQALVSIGIESINQIIITT